MIDHFGINCTDLEASARFYDAVLGVLGHRRLMDVGVAIGYGTDKPDFWISGGEAMGWHGSFLTTGGALGAPIAGLAIDRGGSPAGFVTVAAVGLLVAVAGVTTTRVRRATRDRRQPSPR